MTVENPTTGLESLTEADLLGVFRQRLDAKDSASEVLKQLSADADEAEYEIRKRLEASGRWSPGCKTAIPGLTVTVNEKARARYEPDQWAAIVEWAGRTGNQHVIQRRLNDKSIVELAQGKDGLPPGVLIEFINEIGFRRL